MQWKSYINSLPAYKSAKLTTKQAKHIVKLSSNENPLGPSPQAIAAMQAALPSVYRYPDAGAVELRHALAEHAGLRPEMVACSNGSDEMILLICLAFLREGDSAVMANGSFISYLLRTLEMGGQAIRVPLLAYTHDLAAMAEAITPETRVIFVCNPNNPTGTCVGAAELQALFERVPENVLIVVDEAYAEYVGRADYPDTLAELRAGRKNLLVLRTFAKIHGLAGMRLGYAYGDAELIAYLDRTRPTFNVNLLAQVAGLAALADSEHVVRSRQHADASRRQFMQAMEEMGLAPIASETNFIAVAVPDETAVSDRLYDRGFTVNPLGSWGLPGLIRVSFGLPEENERFLDALREVLER